MKLDHDRATKQCTKCETTKPVGEFYKAKSRPKGRSHCISCMRNQRRRWILKNEERLAMYRATYRKNNKERITEWRKSNRERAREYMSDWRKRNTERLIEYRKSTERKEKHAASVARSRRKWPIRQQARNKVQQAIKCGALKQQPCIVCGSEQNIEAHHSDYSKPLDVDWLCRKHHVLWHRYLQPYNG